MEVGEPLEAGARGHVKAQGVVENLRGLSPRDEGQADILRYSSKQSSKRKSLLGMFRNRFFCSALRHVAIAFIDDPGILERDPLPSLPTTMQTLVGGLGNLSLTNI